MTSSFPQHLGSGWKQARRRLCFWFWELRGQLGESQKEKAYILSSEEPSVQMDSAFSSTCFSCLIKAAENYPKYFGGQFYEPLKGVLVFIREVSAPTNDGKSDYGLNESTVEHFH